MKVKNDKHISDIIVMTLKSTYYYKFYLKRSVFSRLHKNSNRRHYKNLISNNLNVVKNFKYEDVKSRYGSEFAKPIDFLEK